LKRNSPNNPHWTNEDVDRIAQKLNIEKSKVYKWNWDQKKKLNILPSKVYALEIPEGKFYMKDGTDKSIKV